MDKVEIGIRIAKIRQHQPMTQAELAETINISIKHLSEIERGIKMPSYEKMCELCNVLGTSFDYIIMGKESCTEYDLPIEIIEIITKGTEAEKKVLDEYLEMFSKVYKLNSNK